MYTDPAQWQHVPTEQNIVDPCSRGTGLVELAESPLWWDGLERLSKKKSEWLKMQPVDHPPTVMQEMKTVKKQETGDEDTGLQSSLLSITMNRPTIQQVLIFCCPK